MGICNDNHRYNQEFLDLPIDQGGKGRHKCAACAYEKGYNDGSELKESIQIELDSLHESQAGHVRHRSPHAAYALGYLKGVNDFYA